MRLCCYNGGIKLFLLTIFIVIVQRLIELVIARANEKKMRLQGAYEIGTTHYRYMLALHISFFVSLLLEVYYKQLTPSPFIVLLLLAFFIVQALRIWCLLSLGMFWNTKIIILPGAQVIKKGPYRFIRHPNYLIVALEIILLPSMFQAYITATLFTLLNIAILSIRIPLEEKALREATNYNEKFPI